MISLDQVLLLEQKVESAVEKISQLQAENDALRSKCAELTNSLSSKTELLSSFESEQNRIENGILKALDRLNSIENSILKEAGQSMQQNTDSVNNEPQQADKTPAAETEQSQIQTEQQTFNTSSAPVQAAQPSLTDTAAPVQNQNNTVQNSTITAEQTQPVTPPENGQFDIF